MRQPHSTFNILKFNYLSISISRKISPIFGAEISVNGLGYEM